MFRNISKRFGLLEWISVAILIVVLVFAVFPGFIAPFDPLKPGAGRPLLPPGGEYLFGTDELGRDVFSRVVWGARLSVAISLSGMLTALFFGMILGSIIAVRRDYVGAGVAMLINLVLVFPGVILAIALATVLTPSATTTAIVLAVLYTPPIARLVSASIRTEYGRTYVAALQISGASDLFILSRAVSRSIAAVVATFALVILADAVLLEAALSFIGVGVQPPTPSWGNIVSGGRNLMASGRWWVATSGGVTIVLFALAVNLLGDALGGRKLRLPRPKARAVSSSLPIAPVPKDALLSVRNLKISIPEHYGEVPVVAGVSLDLRKGEMLSLVGESGSGKSLVAKAILGILPRGTETTGSVVFDGRELLGSSGKALKEIRGKRLAFLPQDSIAALNPCLKIENQIGLVLEGAGFTAKELLEQVRLPAERVLGAYPHELSGGQCQRIALAISLARRPDILIADEPTTALDVSVQAEIFELIADLRRELGFSMLLITHDLPLVAAVTDRIAVAYAGRIVETGSAHEVLTQTRHPYTKGLLRSVQSMEAREPSLYSIGGTVPNPKDFGTGCRFAGRCEFQQEFCLENRPQLNVTTEHPAACHFPLTPEKDAAA
ncbi:dipeptide/oligopeptide/nickel ABC transporter permease/ATP-binding protein [Celeribacter sp.]|uniref:dipeptide/oligopeptide/nickel ABC transporter permease/ATP-binding protein n=1 Tax=Celeribacter sp. TaxID=1890673 RepID=UPI003A8F468C